MSLKDRIENDGRGFTDLLFNLVLGYAYLFLIAFLLINPIKKDNNIEPKALYKLVVTWPDSDINDIDTWVKCDKLSPVSFRSKDNGVIHLDRDDRGATNDTIVINGVQKIANLNYEIVNFRQKYPCRYQVNMHLFSRNDGLHKDIPIVVEFYKLQPYAKLAISNVTLKQEGSEIGALQFTIDLNGDVIDIETDTEARWVNKAVSEQYSNSIGDPPPNGHPGGP